MLRVLVALLGRLDLRELMPQDQVGLVAPTALAGHLDLRGLQGHLVLAALLG